MSTPRDETGREDRPVHLGNLARREVGDWGRVRVPPRVRQIVVIGDGGRSDCEERDSEDDSPEDARRLRSRLDTAPMALLASLPPAVLTHVVMIDLAPV